MADELDISLPITSKDQLIPYKDYLLVVNMFIGHFRKNGLPANERELNKLALGYPEITLSPWLRKQAAEDARGAFTTARAFTTAPIAPFSRKEEKAMRKMSEEEKNVFIREREEKHLKRGEKYLDDVIRRNAEPMIEIEMKNGRRCRVEM
jgi:hypothetical protein